MNTSIPKELTPGSKECTFFLSVHMCVLSCFSHFWLCVTLWTQPARILCPWDSPGKEYWSGLPFPSLGDLPNPGIELTYLASPALAEVFFTTGTTWEAISFKYLLSNFLLWRLFQSLCGINKCTYSNISVYIQTSWCLQIEWVKECIYAILICVSYY